MKTGTGKTHVGKIRKKNQDAILVRNEKVGPLENLFIVADGMGGHKAGEVAAAMAVSAFLEYAEKGEIKGGDVEGFLKEGVRAANGGIISAQMKNKEFSGMGTTISLCTFAGNKLFFAHVGDSRIYKADSEGIRQISKDHSLVAELQRQGKITAEEAKSHPNKNILLQALGTDSELNVETGSLDGIGPDVFILICSDGLSNMVSDEDILAELKKTTTAEEKCAALTELAILHGGTDNISLIIVK